MTAEQEMNADELRKEVSEITWFHRMNLGQGIVTPGLVDCSANLHRLHLPEDMRGMSVLDVGAWDGFYSFEAERRGASRVLATDSHSWSGEGWGTQDGFVLARRALNSRVEDMDIDVLDISPARVGTFDLVLFLGVFYHMRHPLLALERVASVTGKQLIVETHVEVFPTERPMMVFYPGTELDGDPTNWWGPNPAAVEAMLRVVGFREVNAHFTEPPPPQPTKRWFRRAPLPSSTAPTRARMVFHARR